MAVPVLATLSAPIGTSIRDVAMRHQLSYRQAHRAVHTLAKDGLVRLEHSGKNVLIEPASQTLGALAAALLRKDHPAWPHVFHGDRILLLHAIHRLHDIPLAAEVTGYARASAYQAAKQLAYKGLLLYKRDSYAIPKQHADLQEFVEEWTRIRAQHRCLQLHPEARVVYHIGPEVLFRAPGDTSGAQPAGLTAFGQHGIDILPADPVSHALAWRPLTAADHLCQALRDGADAITRSYAALLLEREHPPRLQDAARIYDVASEAQAVMAYVETRQEQDGFLPWNEHQRYRRMYLNP